MDIARYKEVEDIFVEVVELSSDQRTPRIHELTADQDLIESVEQLLSEHDRLAEDEFLEPGLFDDSIGLETISPDLPCPSHIRDYSIIRVLGKGASGTVYLAKSPLPLERLVALKLINHGAGELTLARFREEQRVLARLQHVGIAEVYDEGISESDRPFTVLEYVEGSSITDYCNAHEINWRIITELIIQCCSAVSHAHHRNIIHRDIKPSNLMVTQEHGAPRVKVIDFGTAKFADPYQMATRLTIDSQFIGTLPYASPEQLSGNETPDTRTDVHALGIVLYECIEQKHPFFKTGNGLKATIDLIMSKPIPALAPKPGVPVRELNAILAKACAKEPTDRYPSLVHFSEDLQHLLAGMPVHAMRHQPVYIARKFMRRHRGPLGIALVVMAALATLAGIAIDRGIQATHNRNALRATAIRLVDDLMPMLSDLNGSSKARHELAASLHERIDDLLATDSSDYELLIRKSRVLEYESDMMLYDGKIDEAESLRSQAAQIIKSLIGSKGDVDRSLSRDKVQLIIKLGDIAKKRERYAIARTYYEQAHRRLLAMPGDQRNELCWSFERLSSIAEHQLRDDDCFNLAQQRMDLAVELLNEHPDSPAYLHNTATSHFLMAEKYMARNDADASIQHARRSMDLASQLIQIRPDHFSSQIVRLNAASTLTRSLYFAGLNKEADNQANIVRQLAMELVELNQGRNDVRVIAWNKLWLINNFWRKTTPDKDRSALREEMHAIMPERNAN